MTHEEANAYISELEKESLEAVAANAKKGINLEALLTKIYPDQAHFVYELLQNAEDAEAGRVELKLTAQQLVVTHNGKKEFRKDDVFAITSVGASTKDPNDVNQAGKFGVGFKSVFAYTATPQIYSGPFAFGIRDLIVPYFLNEAELIPGETKFKFPFNKSSKPPNNCRQEIIEWLEAMNENVLLFLRNIKLIRWSSEIGKSAELERQEFPNGVVGIHCRYGTAAPQTSTYWLRFTESTPLGTVAVAFKLEAIGKRPVDPTKPVREHFRVVPTNGKLSVYFPADKETTNLLFHLHGPYAATVARDSIPTGNPSRPGEK